MSNAPAPLQEIATKLKENPNYEHLPLTTRGLLRLFGSERRGSWVVSYIRTTLKALGIETEPNFENTWIDSPIKLRLIPKVSPKQPAVAPLEVDISYSLPKEEEDPTFRIGRLEAVSRPVVSVKPDDSIEKAVTIMLLQDFSQVPVMTTDRSVKGMLTWKSISSSLSLGGSNAQVKDCMTPHYEVRDNVSLFDAMPGIILNGYVIIRSEDNSIAGLLTVGGLSYEFRQLTNHSCSYSKLRNTCAIFWYVFPRLILKQSATRYFQVDPFQKEKFLERLQIFHSATIFACLRISRSGNY